MSSNIVIEINTEKQNYHSFLVALVPVPSLPDHILPNIDVMDSECAVVAANHNLDGNNKFAYVHLEKDEKQAIGNALANSCVRLNEWVWCNMYKDDPDEDNYPSEKCEALREAAQEFCDRCERGEVRSRYTYSKFKRILEG